MPSLSDIARFFSTLQTIEIVGGLAITAALLVLISDWRLSLLAFAAQYVLIASLLSTLVPPQIALVRVIAGALAAAILYITARQNAQLGRRARREQRLQLPPPFLIGWHFRAVALVLVAVTVIALTEATILLTVPVLFWLVSLWLMGSGLLIVALTRDVFKYGQGLLTFTAGFGALYLALDSGLAIYGALNTADLIIALALAHLAGAPFVNITRRRRGEK